MKKTILMIVLVCWTVAMVRAQKTCVIANAEDHVPVREALIHTDNNHWARTDYRGYWTMKYQFDSATVSKPGFLKTTIYLKNLPDTVFLLPQSHQLREVEVWGENMPGIKGIQNDAHRQAEIGGANAPSGASFDLAKMLDKRGRRDSKHLREAQKIFGEMDRKDPIVAAYEKATGKKYQANDSMMKSSVEPIEPRQQPAAASDAEKAKAAGERNGQDNVPEKNPGKEQGKGKNKEQGKEPLPVNDEKSSKKVRVSVEQSVSILK